MNLFFSLLLTSVMSVNPSWAAAENTSPAQFRGLFGEVYSLVHQKKLSDEEIKKLIYLPPGDLFSEVSGLNGPCAHCKIQEKLRGLKTRDFFNSGREGPVQKISPDDFQATLQRMQKHETLVVIVPGIFGEFIDSKAINEVFEGPSVFASNMQKQFAQKLEGRPCREMSETDQSRYCDERQMLKNLDWQKNPTGSELVSIDQLFDLGSWDLGDRALVNVALFHLDPFSLESLGDTAERAAIFSRRLEKLFGIMGHIPEQIIFVGYSRGTAFGLEMLSQAVNKDSNWVSHVEGFVSLGGVVFGSSLADEAQHSPDSKVYRQLQAVNELLNSMQLLDPSESAIKRMTTMFYNTKAFASFLGQLVAIEGLTWKDGVSFDNFRKGVVVDGLSLFGLTKKLIENFGLLNKGLTIDSYNSDVLRFKKFMGAALVGVNQLSTDERLQWWTNATLPKGLRLYSVIGLMDGADGDLFNGEMGFSPLSSDDALLRKNWQQYTNVRLGALYEGSPLNDSQVSLAKAHFWPQVIQELNSNLAHLKIQPLAIVGTHHWGLALPVVNPTLKVIKGSEGTSTVQMRNPFPRKAFLYSLAAAINWDLLNEPAQSR